MELTKLSSLSIAILLVSCSPTSESSPNQTSPNDSASPASTFKVEQEGESLNAKISYDLAEDKPYKYVVKDYSNKEIQTLESEGKTTDFTVPRHGKYNIDVFENDTKLETLPLTLSATSINIAYLRATAPVSLFTYLNLQEDAQTYVDLARGNTYKWDKLPETWHLIPGIRENYNKEDFNTFQSSDSTVVSSFVSSIIEELEDVKVHFYVCDVEGSKAYLPLLKDYKNPNYKFTFLTDGTLTNSYLIDNVNTIEKYNQEKADIQSKFDDPSKFENFDGENAFVFSTLVDNADFYILEKESVRKNAQDEQIKKILDDNLIVLDYQKIYEGLLQTPEMQSKFEYLFGTRWGDGENDNMSSVFSKSEKPNIVILGTSPTAEESADFKGITFEEFTSYVIQNYGATYDIFYKGHPAYPSNDERKAFLTNNSIEELQSSVPAEILLTLYPDVFTGGYLSSTYLSATNDQQIKFVYTSKESFDKNTTFDGKRELFANSEFLVDVLKKYIVET